MGMVTVEMPKGETAFKGRAEADRERAEEEPGAFP